jgi:hypothetical protein
LFKEVMSKPHTTPTPIQERVKDLAELKQMSETLWPRDKEDNMGDAVMDAAGDMGPKWLRPYLPVVIPVLTGLAQSFLTPRPSPPAPVQYPVQPQTGYPQPPVQFPTGPTPNAPLIPTPIGPNQLTNPAVVPQLGPVSVPGMPPEVSNLLHTIKDPLLVHISDVDKTGTDFAGWFIDGYGMPTHNQIIAFGHGALFQAVCAYPPIAGELSNMRMPEKRVREFVAEFCNPKWDNESVEGEQGNGVGTVPTTIPVA